MLNIPLTSLCSFIRGANDLSPPPPPVAALAETPLGTITPAKNQSFSRRGSAAEAAPRGSASNPTPSQQTGARAEAPFDAALHHTRKNHRRALRESPGVTLKSHSVYFEAADASFVTPRYGSAFERESQEGFCVEKCRRLSGLTFSLSSLTVFGRTRAAWLWRAPLSCSSTFLCWLTTKKRTRNLLPSDSRGRCCRRRLRHFSAAAV